MPDLITPLPDDDKNGTDAHHPSRSLLLFLEEEIKKENDFYKNLSTEYDETIYKDFEDRFIGVRNEFKGKLQDISNMDYEFINHTDLRKKAVEQIISCASKAAGKFQEARENKRLDRSSCTDALEDLIYAIKNLKHLIEEQGKI